MKAEVYIALGSNLGDRYRNITRAADELKCLSSHFLLSALYETDPVGFSVQPGFVNAVCKLWTNLSPFDLWAKISQIQDTIGGSHSFLNAPRFLDIDLLTYSDWVFEIPGLKVPHPRMYSRGFVLKPMADVGMFFRHPVLKKSVIELLQEIEQ